MKDIKNRESTHPHPGIRSFLSQAQAIYYLSKKFPEYKNNIHDGILKGMLAARKANPRFNEDEQVLIVENSVTAVENWKKTRSLFRETSKLKDDGIVY